MNNPLLVKNFLSGAAIEKYRIVKFGADDDHIVKSAAVGDAHMGVSIEVEASAAEQRIDAVLSGVAEVQYGAAVTRGDMLTSDANGKAVVAAPGAGVNNNIIGQAMVSGVLDDIGSVNVNPGKVQG